LKRNEIKNSSHLFLYKAKIDLNAGKYLLDGFNNDYVGLDLATIMFHLQQCSEKLLKSLLSFGKIRVNKNHDVRQLIEICHSNSIALTSGGEVLKDLTEYSVDGRYAIIHDDLDNADKYIVVLDKFVEFVRDVVKWDYKRKLKMTWSNMQINILEKI